MLTSTVANQTARCTLECHSEARFGSTLMITFSDAQHDDDGDIRHRSDDDARHGYDGHTKRYSNDHYPDDETTNVHLAKATNRDFISRATHELVAQPAVQEAWQKWLTAPTVTTQLVEHAEQQKMGDLINHGAPEVISESMHDDSKKTFLIGYINELKIILVARLPTLIISKATIAGDIKRDIMQWSPC